VALCREGAGGRSEGTPAMPPTPRNGLRGVGMVLQTRDSRAAQGSASFFAAALGPRPQEFVVKELLEGPAADCRTISCGDCLVEVEGIRVEGRTLRQVRGVRWRGGSASCAPGADAQPVGAAFSLTAFHWQVQSLIRGPSSTSVTIRLTREHGRDYTVSLVRGDGRSRHSCRDEEERTNYSTALLPCSPSAHGLSSGTNWSPESPGRSETRGGPEPQECHAFWAEAQQKIVHLKRLAKGECEWPIAGWGAPPKGALMADTASCLRELQKLSLDADPGSKLRLELIEDMVFLRDQVRYARVELMESVFEKNALDLTGNVSVSLDNCAASPNLSVSLPGDIRSGGCGRCERLFAHLQSMNAQRAQLHTATVRHRIRVGTWEHRRLKAASEMWLQAARLGASLEHIALELAEIRETFDQEAPIHFFSSVLLGQKSQFHGDARLNRNAIRTSWNAGNPSRNGVSGTDGEQVSRMSLPVNSSFAANARTNMIRAGRGLGALCERAAEVNGHAKRAHKMEQNDHSYDPAHSEQVQQLMRQVAELKERLAISESNAAATASLNENAHKLQRENEALKKELLVIANLEQKIEEQEAQWAKDVATLVEKLAKKEEAFEFLKVERIKQLENALTEAQQEKHEARTMITSLQDTLQKQILELRQSEVEQEAALEEIKTLRESIEMKHKQLETTQQMCEDERKQKETNAERIKHMEEEVSKYPTRGIDRDALQHLCQQRKDMYEEEHRAKVLLQNHAIEAIRGAREAHQTEMTTLKGTIERVSQDALMEAVTGHSQRQAQVIAELEIKIKDQVLVITKSPPQSVLVLLAPEREHGRRRTGRIDNADDAAVRVPQE
jgi:hypothetical protein